MVTGAGLTATNGMAHTTRAPKQWPLGKEESITSVKNWRQNLVYTLSTDANFAPVLVPDAEWLKKSPSAPLRSLTPTMAPNNTTVIRTAEQKVAFLELMLGQIANYTPIISRRTIVNKSTSMSYVWSAIRLHFGFEITGAHFLDLSEITLVPGERAEDLYQRIISFVEESLLTKEGNITHHDEVITQDEEMSPTVENMIVVRWLQLLHSNLPKLVKQRYGTELRTRTLASIKPEISQALPSLLQELKTVEEVRVIRSEVQNTRTSSSSFNNSASPSRSSNKSCCLCLQAGRQNSSTHYLSEC